MDSPDLTRRETLAASALAGLAAATPAWAQQATPPAAPTGAAWDLTDLFPDDASWDAARRKVLAAIPGLAPYKGTLGQSADRLTAALTQQSDLGRAAARVSAYASLAADADIRIAANQERQAQARDLYVTLGEATSWIAPELLTLGKAKIDGFIATNEVLRKRFAHGLADTLRQADHTLTPEGEALLASAGAPLAGLRETREQLVAAAVPWPTITLSTGEHVRLDDQGYTLHRDAPARADRKAVFDAFWTEYGRFRAPLGAAYSAHVRDDIFRAKARRYPTSLARALSGYDIPEGVYRTLVAEANAGLPQLHRYFELRRRLLKLPDMAYYDIYPPLVRLDRRFTVPEMRELTMAAVKPLGDDYGALLAKGTAAKWMDPLPRPGKKSGAYMNPAAAYDVHPYLLLNLGKNYEGMSTYAHEWGHAMHTLLADRAQPYDTAGYPIFLAEIASTCNEQLLSAYMVGRAKTREEKLFYLGQQLESIRGTFYRQTMFAEFELITHDHAEKGEGLSGERFTGIYLDLLKRYHGPKVAIDPVYAAEWAYIPHFYTSFYVYQYATCVSAAAYFARSILAGGARERDNYLAVLKAGGSDYPTAILKRAGLDMAGPAPYRAVVAAFKDTLDQVQALIA